MGCTRPLGDPTAGTVGGGTTVVTMVPVPNRETLTSRKTSVRIGTRLGCVWVRERNGVCLETLDRDRDAGGRGSY